MRPPCNRIQLHDGQALLPVAMKFGGNHPQAGICIRCGTVAGKPLDESTRVVGVAMGEGEEKEYAPDNHPKHARQLGIDVDKDGVSARISTVPSWVRSNPLAVHPTRAAEVAWGIKTGRRRVVNIDSAVEAWAAFKRDVGRVDVRVGIQLLVQKTTQEVGKLRLMDVGGKFWEAGGIITL